MPGTNVFNTGARVFVIACLIFGLGCKANFPEAPTPTPTLSSIQLHYNSPHDFVTVGNSVSLTLYALNSEGIFENVTQRATWISVNPEIASVTPGSARGVRGGITDVIVTYQGLTKTARIIVIFPGQITPALTLRIPALAAGETSQARAFIGVTDVTNQAAWSSSDPSVLTVTAGRITSVAPGTTEVSATLNNTTATSYVSVPPVRSLPSLP